jgi:osmotically-inducible protein OsmY
MKTVQQNVADVQLRDHVMQQLEWESDFDATAIGVAAAGGTVTLTGFVDTYAAKLAAERTVKRVRGVRAVANDIQVRLRLERTDADIAADAVQALSQRSLVPESVQAVVHNGHLTLTGTVPTLYQSAVAQKAVRDIKGIRGLVNHITVTPAPAAADPAADIMRALRRQADLDSYGIEVTATGDTAVLKGTVRTWRERDAVERAAMHSRGISRVVNLLAVGQENEVG